MKFFILACLAVLFCCNGINAQSIRQIAKEQDTHTDVLQKGNQNQIPPKPGRNKTAALKVNKRNAAFNKDNTYTNLGEISEADDYVLYRNVMRRYTWLVGVGDTISQEIADRLPYYFRLSMKNEAGNYQLVEAMHGDSLTSAHPLDTYILDKDNDTDESNGEWRERLSKVGRWLFYSDLSGEKVVEERAYEAKGENARLVYAMQVVQNDSMHVTLSYLDSWGLPADMNESAEYTYGSVVCITYDSNGCDAIVDFLDGQGYRKENTDGVDQRRYVYDDRLRPVLVTSNNCVGDYVIDNWGNCGVMYSYDDRHGSCSITYVDEELRPMRMPGIRAGGEKTFIRCDYKKDEWGRTSEAVMLTADGRPDSTLSGIHRIVFTYSPDGRLQKKTCYDINGNELSD